MGFIPKNLFIHRESKTPQQLLSYLILVEIEMSLGLLGNVAVLHKLKQQGTTLSRSGDLTAMNLFMDKV